MRTAQRCLLFGLILGLASGRAGAQVVSLEDIEAGGFSRIEVASQAGLGGAMAAAKPKRPHACSRHLGRQARVLSTVPA